MAGFLYFVPGLHGLNKDDLVRLGLAEVFAGVAPTCRECTPGPDGGPGVVLAAPPNEYAGGIMPAVGFHRSTQTWHKAGSYWLGIETENPPRPADLQRPETIDGYRLRLEDGRDWLIPVARHFEKGSVMPRRLCLGPEGEVIFEALPRYARFCTNVELIWRDCRRLFRMLSEGEEPLTLTDKQVLDFAVEALGVNYRVAIPEAALLQILTTQNMNLILNLVVDLPAYLAVQKDTAEAVKKNDPSSTPDGCNSSAGSPAA